jgi:hypothetical protein
MLLTATRNNLGIALSAKTIAMIQDSAEKRKRTGIQIQKPNLLLTNKTKVMTETDLQHLRSKCQLKIHLIHKMIHR